MLARIWWKEARTLWPLWASVLAIAAVVVVAGFSWRFGEVDDLRDGVLVPVLACISLLYAFAVGATTFAGERETKTLLFLDALPVPRRTLWAGKVGFAYATALALALGCVLLALALSYLAWDRYGPPPMRLDAFGTPTTAVRAPLPVEQIPWSGLIFLAEAIAWGLFWSALKENVLTVAILSVAGGELAFTPFSGGHGSAAIWQGPALWLLRGAYAASGLVASWVLMTRAPRSERAARARRSDVMLGQSLRRSTARQLARTPRIFGFLCLVWETIREAWRTWLWLLGAGIFGLGFLAFNAAQFGSYQDRNGFAYFALLVGGLLGLVAGVHVFGLTNRLGERRFPAHHGVHGATIWWAKTP